MVDEAVVCTKCGNAAGTTEQIIADVLGIEQKIIDGLLVLILGVVGLVYSLVTMGSAISHTDAFYHYAGVGNNLNGIEIMLTIFVIFMISIVLIIVGALMLRKCIVKSKIFAAYKIQRGRKYVMYLTWLAFIGILVSFFLPLK